MKKQKRFPIFVSLDADKPNFCGALWCEAMRGKEVFSFEYDKQWLQNDSAFMLDPKLGFYTGPQYTNAANFGVFLDSSPDRWGRFLIKRRESLQAREEKRDVKILLESDYLLGVHDIYRVGALRFQTEITGSYLACDKSLAVPPWTSLRELEFASMQVAAEDAEDRNEYAKWLYMLVAPGGSLGGARPKASVVDEKGHLWLAKFPGRLDRENISAWEMVVHKLGHSCGLCLPEARLLELSHRHHTFLVKRFDRTEEGRRLFFISAMTALSKSDGDDAATGVSYLHLADLLLRFGSNTNQDLLELWSRMLFNVLVSNTDDHLRNHGFIVDNSGWKLSPAFDINPNSEGEGLKLNISEDDNSQNLELLLSVAKYFRIKPKQAQEKIKEYCSIIKEWKQVALQIGLSRSECEHMSRAFRNAN